MFNQKGFTILEILIVVLIIALIATLVGLRLSTAQQDSRNAKRLSDMQQVEKALLAFKETNGVFPAPNSYGEGTVAEGCKFNSDSSAVDRDGDGIPWLDQLVDSGTMPSVPVDPNQGTLCDGSDYTYYYNRAPAGTGGCPAERGDYFILAIEDMEGSTGAYETSPGVPECTFDFQGQFEWVTAGFTN